MTRMTILAIGLLLTIDFVGCNTQTSQPVAQPAAPEAHGPSAAGAQYVLASEPAAAQDVKAVRAEAANGDEVAVVGRIGGDVNPWVDGRAAFTIVDTSLHACSDIPGDACPTPWDYCCETDQLKTGKLLVKIVDDAGQLVATDARELLGVDHLDTVVVQGTVEKSEDGAIVLLATGLYVREHGAISVQLDGDHEGHDHDHDHGHDHEHGDDHDHPETGGEHAEESTQT